MSLQNIRRKYGHNKKAMITTLVICVIIAIIALIIASWAGKKKQEAKDAKEAEEIQLNEAGGRIDDIDWDTVIGYDADMNPIYKSFGKVDNILGYDIFGAPVPMQDPTGTADDGLPIYGGYSAIDEAAKRGKKKGDSDVNWDRIGGYDTDGNPIYASISGDPSLIGYDANGNPVYVSDVQATGQTINGLPVYDYSAIGNSKKQGKIDAAELNKRMDNMQDEIDDLQRQIDELKKQKSSKADGTGSQSDKQKADDKARDQKLKELSDELAKAKAELDKLNKDNSQSASNSKNKTRSDLDTAREIRSLKETIIQLKKSIELLKAQAGDNSTTIITLKEENARLGNDLNNSKDKTYDTEEALRTAKEELERSKSETDSKNTTIDSLTKELNAKNAEIELLKKRGSDISAIMRGLYSASFYDNGTDIDGDDSTGTPAVFFSPYKGEAFEDGLN